MRPKSTRCGAPHARCGNAFGTRAREFASETTLHGLKELGSDVFGNAGRIIWALILLVSCVMMILQAVSTTTEYLSAPTATKLTINPINGFPDLVYCPYAWLDPMRAEFTGFTTEMFMFVHSLLVQSPIRFGMMGQMRTWLEEGMTEMVVKEVNRFRMKLAEKNYTIERFVREASYEPRRAVDEVMTDLRRWFDIKWLMNTAGVCYRLRDTRPFHAYWARSEMMAVEVRVQKPAEGTLLNLIESHDQLFIGETGKTVFPLGGYYLHPGMSYYVRISGQRIVRSTRSTTACSAAATEGQLAACTVKCMYDTCAKAQLCKPLVRFGTTEKRGMQPDDDHAKALDALPIQEADIDDYCTYLKPKEHCLYQNDTARDCVAKCPKPCDYRIYTASFTPLTPDLRNRTFLMITMDNPETSVTVEEYESFSRTTLACNIGGTLSLFLGCSLVTFAHAALFWCLRAVGKDKKRRGSKAPIVPTDKRASAAWQEPKPYILPRNAKSRDPSPTYGINNRRGSQVSVGSVEVAPKRRNVSGEKNGGSPGGSTGNRMPRSSLDGGYKGRMACGRNSFGGGAPMDVRFNQQRKSLDVPTMTFGAVQ